jgi:hypothetical protein
MQMFLFMTSRLPRKDEWSFEKDDGFFVDPKTRQEA